MKDANALNRGLWLGLAGIVIFAATLPLTRLAVGTPEAPHMSSLFVALARAALAALELLRVRLARTRIVAPTAGVLGARRLSVGDYATPAAVVTTLDDLSALKVTFRVPERSIPQVKPGTRITARVRIGAAERPVETEGEVFFVSASIDPAVRASEVKAVLRDPLGAVAFAVARGGIGRPLGLPVDGVHAGLPKS
jgi:multidrug efflux pump subunit AcrA (membrane-fusion protein)